MLHFSLRQFELAGRFYVPMPKMTPRQMRILERRLDSLGFRPSGAGVLRAAKGGQKVCVDPAGLCWSNRSAVDVIAPAIPEVLAAEKLRVSLRALRRTYFDLRKQGGASVLRLKPRLESSSRWTGLRAEGSCALTPDERSVYAFLFSSSSLLTELPTDFPVAGSRVRRAGRVQYYDSPVGSAEAASALRGLGGGGARNAYLPRDSVVRLSSFEPSARDLKPLFEGLGEWCYLSPR